jgi:hypothetical protein
LERIRARILPEHERKIVTAAKGTTAVLKDEEIREALADILRRGVRAGQRQQARDVMAAAQNLKQGIEPSLEEIGEMAALNIRV